MLNKDGITTKKYGSDKQILFAIEQQVSVGCRVPATMAVTQADGKKIVQAGTPLKIDMNNLQTVAVLADGTNAMNAVLLHNVDVTTGTANGTALIFGFINLNRVATEAQTKLATARANASASKMFTFLKA